MMTQIIVQKKNTSSDDDTDNRTEKINTSSDDGTNNCTAEHKIIFIIITEYWVTGNDH